MVNIVKGDLIRMTFEGHFDVVAHGCNCMCIMGNGIAPLMAKAFGCDQFPLEHKNHIGDTNKLGVIDYQTRFLTPEGKLVEPLQRAKEVSATNNPKGTWKKDKAIFITNCYTQYEPGVPNKKFGVPLDYDALTMCMKKINNVFHKMNIGLPWIGCGLAGGRKDTVFDIINTELVDCNVTIVEL